VVHHARDHPLALATFGSAIAATRLRRPLRLPHWLVVPALVARPVAVARLLPPGRARSYATFLAHMWSYLNAFELPHDDHAAQRARLRIHYVAEIDRRLGAGRVPGARLQRLRARPRLAALLDRLFGAIYFAWSVERHAALGWLLWRHRESFGRAATRVSATFDLALLAQAIVPTAPPWYAAKYGHLQDPVRRVTVHASRLLPMVPEQTSDEAEAANPWASMPSSHFATASMIALSLAETDRRAGGLAAVYALALAIALVYLGEHYVIDVLAGAALVSGLRTLESRSSVLLFVAHRFRRACLRSSPCFCSPRALAW
jgi:membrane-associated phospholipid phosphatase